MNDNLNVSIGIGFGEVFIKGNERRTCPVESKRHASNISLDFCRAGNGHSIYTRVWGGAKRSTMSQKRTWWAVSALYATVITSARPRFYSRTCNRDDTTYSALTRSLHYPCIGTSILSERATSPPLWHQEKDLNPVSYLLEPSLFKMALMANLCILGWVYFSRTLCSNHQMEWR